MESDSTGDIISIADIVLNLNGRDKGKLFFVTAAGSEYVCLADGGSRRLENPKRKKVKHIKLIASGDSRTAEKLRTGEKVTNAELRRALIEFSSRAAEEV